MLRFGVWGLDFGFRVLSLRGEAHRLFFIFTLEPRVE